MTVIRTAAVVTGLAFLLAGCGGGGVSLSGCRDAATAQAESERAWAAVIEAHNAAHGATADHLELEEQLLDSRVDVIVAIESTRRAC